MSWRAVWAKAELTPVLVSAMFWSVVTAIAPTWVTLILLVAWATAVAVWRTPAMLRWRYQAGPIAGPARDRVLRALVPAACLRGRQQPLVWRSPRLPQGVVAADNRNLIWSDGLLEQIIRGHIDDDQASALALHALGTAEIQASRVVAAVRLFTTPWRALASLIGTRLFPDRLSIFGHFASATTWVVLAIAAADLYQRRQWFALPFLMGGGFALLTAMPWRRRWHRMLDELGDRYVARHGFGDTYARLLSSHSDSCVRQGMDPLTSRPSRRPHLRPVGEGS